MRRAEMARRRKNLSEKRKEEEKVGRSSEEGELLQIISSRGPLDPRAHPNLDGHHQ